MAVSTTLEVYGGLFTMFMPGYINVLSRKCTSRKIGFGKLKWEGEKLVKKLAVSWNVSGHNTVDGGAIAPGKGVQFVDVKGTRKIYTQQVSCSEGVLAAAASTKQSAVKLSDYLLRNSLECQERYDNFMTWRDGTGKVATLGTVVSGAYISVDDARGFHPKADYEIRDSTGATIKAAVTCKNVQRALSSGESIVYLEASLPVAAGCVQGDIITWGVGEYSSYGRAVTGLDVLIDDALTTFQGVDCSAYPFFTSPVYDGGGSAYTLTPQLLRLVQAMLKQESPDFEVPGGMLVITSAWDAANIEGMYENALRITPESKAVGFAGGLTVRTAMGTFTYTSDHDLQYGTTFFIDRKQISRPTQQELTWRKHGPEVFWPSPNKLNRVATMYEIADLFIEKRNSSAKMQNMRVTPGSAY
jgi:hypothetical protein